MNRIYDGSFNVVRGNILILIMVIFFLASCDGTDNPNTGTNGATSTGENANIEEEDNQTPVKAIDIFNQQANESLEIVNQELKLYAFSGKEYSFQPDFGSLNNQDGVSYTIKNKPAWATFNKSTGYLSGTPGKVGDMGKDKLILDRVAFNISIIASKGEKRVSTGLFNIIITNENKKNRNKAIVLLTKFSNSKFNPSIQESYESYKRANKLILFLSKGMQDIDVTIMKIEDLGLTNLNIGTWSTTSLFLKLAYDKQLEKDKNAVCEVNEKLMSLASNMLKNMSQTEKDNNGILATDLDFTFALGRGSSNPCKILTIAEIAVPFIKIPTDIDIFAYDYVVVQLADDEINAGSFQSGTNILSINHTGKAEKPFMLAAADKDTFTSKMAFPEFYENVFTAEFHHTYYDGNQEILSRFDRTVAHEFIHAFDVNTHDNGFTSYESEASIIHNLNTGYESSAFEYQNNFSTLGAGDYANGLALATREFLGWINASDIHTITKESLNNQIVDINLKSGKVGAKILTAGGWLYVSFHTGVGYEASIKHPKLINNTKGLLIEYSEFREHPRSVTTSTLLIPSKNAETHDYSLKQGETFSLLGVTIDNVLITGDKLSFDVRYANNFQDLLKIDFSVK